MSWTSALNRKFGRNLYSLIDEATMVAGGLAEKMLWTIFAWSLDVLASGIWPERDWQGEHWEPGSWRARLAGSELAPGGLRAVYLQFVGDWKYLKEVFVLKANYSRKHICFLCDVAKGGGDDSFSLFSMTTAASRTRYC